MKEVNIMSKKKINKIQKGKPFTSEEERQLIQSGFESTNIGQKHLF